MFTEYCLDTKFFNATTTDSGHIFVLNHLDFPGHVRIGKTKRQPSIRAAEMSREASLSRPFDVVWFTFVEDRLNEIYKAICLYLEEFRDDRYTDFFYLPEYDAVKTTKTIKDGFINFLWNGTRYRKKQDARWAYFFELLNIPFTYICEPIKLPDLDISILPDFWLPEQDCYMIISKDFMQSSSGKLAAHCLAKKTGKIVFQFWGCKPGIMHDENDEMHIHAGTHMTPEGDFDGMMEWGNCKICDSRHIGHLSCADVCDSENRNTSTKNCPGHTEFFYESIIHTYTRVQQLFGISEWR